MRWFDGTVYIGEWRNDKQNGYGTLKIASEIRTGYFVDNKYMGMIMPSNDGS